MKACWEAPLVCLKVPNSFWTALMSFPHWSNCFLKFKASADNYSKSLFYFSKSTLILTELFLSSFKFLSQLAPCSSNFLMVSLRVLFSASMMTKLFLITFNWTNSLFLLSNWVFKVAAIIYNFWFWALKASACWAWFWRTATFPLVSFNYPVSWLRVSFNWLLSPFNLSTKTALFFKLSTV